MTLQKFAAIQDDVIKRTGARFARLLAINLSYDLERGVKTAIANNPLLRGVSVREITAEVLNNVGRGVK